MKIDINNLPEANDMIIDKIVKKGTGLNEEIVNKAKEIYNLRNLDSKEKQDLIARFPEILRKGKILALGDKSNLDSIQNYLRKKGIHEDQIPQLALQLSKSEEDKIENKKLNTKSWIFTIVVVIFLLKLLLRMAR